MSQHALCSTILIFFLDVCLSIPLQSYGQNKDYIEASTIPAIAALSVIVLFILVIVSCVCCPHHGLKALGHQNGLPVSRRHDNCLNQNENTSEFTIFPPPSVTVMQPISSVHDKVIFDPLPEIHTRISSHIQGSLPPRPAHLSNVLNKRISLHDWFDVPNNSFPRSSLQYLKEVGSGWFGQVVEGEACNIVSGQTKTPVIVKILREDASPSEHIYFLHEVRPFRDLIHQNLIHLLGYCLESDPFLVIMEHLTMDLKTYLIQQRKNPEPLQNGLLLYMALNISVGLQYMHEHGYIHTDLAARNCCVTEDQTVKIGDYGTSIQNFKDDYYCLGDIALPVRWSAPECLQCTDTTVETKETTREANMWTFGVVLWELLEFGTLPYIELNDEEVLQRVFIEQNYLLEKPKSPCVHKEQIYQIMQFCWKSPNNRPSIQKITALLNHLYELKNVSPDSSSFETRWNALQPIHREHNLLQSIPRDLLFESDFISKTDNSDVTFTTSISSSHVEPSLWSESPNIMSTYYSQSVNSSMSPSLQTLRGSTENLHYSLSDDDHCAIVTSPNVDTCNISTSTSCHSSESKVEDLKTTKKENSDEIIMNLDRNFQNNTEHGKDSLFKQSVQEKYDLKNIHYSTLELEKHHKTGITESTLLTDADKLLKLNAENIICSPLSSSNENDILKNTKTCSFNSLNLDTQQIIFHSDNETSAANHCLNGFIEKGSENNQTKSSIELANVQILDEISVKNETFNDPLCISNNPFLPSLYKSCSVPQSSKVLTSAQIIEDDVQENSYPSNPDILTCEQSNLFTHSNLHFTDRDLFPNMSNPKSNSVVLKNVELMLNEDETQNSQINCKVEIVDDIDRLDKNHISIELSDESETSTNNNILLKTAIHSLTSTLVEFPSHFKIPKQNNLSDTVNNSQTIFNPKYLLEDLETEQADLKCKDINFEADDSLQNSDLQHTFESKIDKKVNIATKIDSPITNHRNSHETSKCKVSKEETDQNEIESYEDSDENAIKINKIQICEVSHNNEENKFEMSLIPVEQHEMDAFCGMEYNLYDNLCKKNTFVNKFTNELQQNKECDINITQPYDVIYDNETSKSVLNRLKINPTERVFEVEVAFSAEEQGKTQSRQLILDENVQLNFPDKCSIINNKSKKYELNCTDETVCSSSYKSECDTCDENFAQSGFDLSTSAIKNTLHENDALLQQINTHDKLEESIPLEEKSFTSSTTAATFVGDEKCLENITSVHDDKITKNHTRQINYSEQVSHKLIEMGISHKTDKEGAIPSLRHSKGVSDLKQNGCEDSNKNSETDTNKSLLSNTENSTITDSVSRQNNVDLHSEFYEQHSHVEKVAFLSGDGEIDINFNKSSIMRSPQSELFKDCHSITNNNHNLKTKHNISVETPNQLLSDTKVCFTVEEDGLNVESDRMSPKLVVSHCASYQDNLDYDDVLRVDTETNEALLLDSSESIIGFVPTRSTELLQEHTLSGMTIKELPSLPNITTSTIENAHFLSLTSQNLDNLSPSSSSAICSGSEDDSSLIRETHPCYLHTGIMPNSCEHAVTQNIEVVYQSEDEIINVKSMDLEETVACVKDLKKHNSVSSTKQECLNYEGCSINNIDLDASEDIVATKEVSQSICWSSNESLSFENINAAGVIIEGKEILAGNGVDFMEKHDKVALTSEVTSDLEPEINSETSESAADDPSPLTLSSGSEPGSPGHDMYTPDFDSDSDETTSTGTSCSSTSGSFECLHNKFRSGTSEEIVSKIHQKEEENGDQNDTSESSPLKVFSGVWDRHATPTRSSMKSPEKKVIQMKKSVSFHEEDPPFVFSYPPASDGSDDGDDEVDERQFVWHLDYTSYADWELQAGDEDEIPENIIEAEDLEENESFCYKSLPIHPLHGSMLYTLTGFSDEDFDSDTRNFSQFTPDISRDMDYDSLEAKQFMTPQYDELKMPEPFISVSELSKDHPVDSKHDEEINDEFSSLQHSFEFHNTSLEVNYSDSSEDDDSEEINFDVDEEDEELGYESHYTQKCKYPLPLQHEDYESELKKNANNNNNKLLEENIPLKEHEINLAQVNLNSKLFEHLDSVNENCMHYEPADPPCSNTNLPDKKGESDLLTYKSNIASTDNTENIFADSEPLETKGVTDMKCVENVDPSENNYIAYELQKRGQDNDTVDGELRVNYTMERADSLIEEAEAFLLSESFRINDAFKEIKAEQVILSQPLEREVVLENNQQQINSVSKKHPLRITSNEILDQEHKSFSDLDVKLPPYTDIFKSDSVTASSDNASLIKSECVSQLIDLEDQYTPVNSVQNSSFEKDVNSLSNSKNYSVCVDSQTATLNCLSGESSTTQEKAYDDNKTTFLFTNTDE